MNRTLISLRSTDHESLSTATRIIFERVGEKDARVSVVKSVKNGDSRTYGVDILFDVFDKPLVEALQRIDFTSNVKINIRTLS